MNKDKNEKTKSLPVRMFKLSSEKLHHELVFHDQALEAEIEDEQNIISLFSFKFVKKFVEVLLWVWEMENIYDKFSSTTVETHPIYSHSNPK
jgi:hypothetical protein